MVCRRLAILLPALRRLLPRRAGLRVGEPRRHRDGSGISRHRRRCIHSAIRPQGARRAEPYRACQRRLRFLVVGGMQGVSRAAHPVPHVSILARVSAITPRMERGSTAMPRHRHRRRADPRRNQSKAAATSLRVVFSFFRCLALLRVASGVIATGYARS